MPGAHPEDPLLLIRCPSCGQRFKVAEGLREKMVECGGCEHRFRIDDTTIIRGKKFYPGEHRDPRLHRFQRVPLAVSPSLVGAVEYGQAPDPALLEPAPPQRIIAGLIGGAIMVLMALLIILGTRAGGTMEGIPAPKLMIMGGFTGLLGTILLAYAYRRTRLRAVLAGVVASLCLVAMPLLFSKSAVIPAAARAEAEAAAEPAQDQTPAKPRESDLIISLRREIGTGPLEEEIERLAAEQSTRRACGLWLRDMQERNRFLIRDYILRAAKADPQTHYYPRGNGNFLMVVTGITIPLEEVARIAAALGSVERTIPEIGIVEVSVNNGNFVEGPMEKLTDRSDPAFYELNKRELESIDLDRIERAVKRLAEAEPKLYREDITRLLMGLLATPEVEFKAAVCTALAKWSDNPAAAGQEALREATSLIGLNQAVPVEMIALCVDAGTPGLAPVMDTLWYENPNQWETSYARMGQAAESMLLSRFPTTSGWHRQSAVRLLGRVGGSESLLVLEVARNSADAELRVLIDKAIASIRARMSGRDGAW